MAHRHGAILWVLLCFLPMMAIRWLPGGRGPVILLLCGIQFLFGELMTHHQVSGWEEVEDLPRLRDGGHYIQLARRSRVVRRLLGKGRLRKVGGRFLTIGSHYEILPRAGTPGEGQQKP